MTDSQRLLQVIKYSKLSPNSFALRIGYERGQTIYNIINNLRPINIKIATNICNHYPEISKPWLLTGEGEMLKQNGKEESLPVTPPPIIDNITLALGIIESQQESIKQLTEATLIQARTLQEMIQRNEVNGQSSVSSKAG